MSEHGVHRVVVLHAGFPADIKPILYCDICKKQNIKLLIQLFTSWEKVIRA